jgi:phospholipase C
MPSNLDKIEHIVVLMMENRSFDHMLGYLKVKKGLPVDGLSGTEQNPDLDGRPVLVSPLANTRFPTDLGHSSADVRAQLEDGNQGFVRNYLRQQKHDEGRLVMGYHDDGHVWAYDRLVASYAVCDRWFSALPGPTIPNRLFAIAGQSGGDTDQPPHGVKIYRHVRTIFDCLDASLRDRPKKERWGYYFHDLPMLSLVEQHIAELLPLGPHRISKIGNFFKRAKTGTLPAVSWIDPNFQDVGDSNDDHPPKSDLYDGQLLVKSVFDAVAGGANDLFRKTLLIVTYDEHGGFFDHVPPAASGDAPPFERFGLRVPALVVSPWIPAGTIDPVERNHSSILRTILDRFAPDEHLTPRVDRAPSLERLLSLAAPRPAIRIDAPPRPPAPRARMAPGPGQSDVFFEAYRTELRRRGALVDGPGGAAPQPRAARGEARAKPRAGSARKARQAKKAVKAPPRRARRKAAARRR